MSLPQQRTRRLAALVLALACVPATSSVAATTGDDSTPASQRSAGTPPSSERCSIPTDQESGSSAKHEITSGGTTRSYILRLPDGYDRRDDWPLIIGYHGRGSTGAEMEGYSELSRLPAVVAYPNGVVPSGSEHRQAWQGAPYGPEGVDDVAFTEDLLDELQESWCTDPTRTYATGKSNGGGLAALLGCRLPDRFAAVAPVAAAFYPGTGEGCRSGSTAPFLSVHGTGDTTIPYNGDEDRDLPAIRDRVSEQARTNGCTGRPSTRQLARDVSALHWRDCHADVAHVAVRGGGHVWPGSDVYSGGGHTTHSIETSRVAWRFFRTHRLTRADEGDAR